jgi:Fe-S cluster assembly protein SufD
LGSLAELRERAAKRFEEIPMPVQKDKGWEFTSLEQFDLGAYPAANGATETAPAHEPVVLPAEIELPEGVIAGPLAAAATEHPDLVDKHLGSLVFDADKFSAQNSALWEDGAFVYVPAGVRVAEPIVLSAVQGTANTALHWRSLIVIEQGAEATVVEQYMSGADDLEAYFNPVTELIVGEGAKLEYLCVQDLSERSWILGTQRASVGRDASLHWIGLGFGSGQGKLRMETDITGRGATARVTGAYVGHGNQHIDYDTTQEHAAPDTVSDLAFRGILRDRATSVWSGMIKVDPGAQRTDAFQESRNLLLSDGSHADAIPGLEIEANDVRCTHAATVSKIDEGQVFYLMSRGLPRADAERLLVGGFLEVIAARLESSDTLRDAVSAALERELETALA